MKKNIFVLSVLLLTLLVACKPNQEKQIKAINQLEKELTNSGFIVDEVKGGQMVRMYMQYANDFPSDSLAPIYLYKASDIALNISHIDTAIICLDKIIEQYPDFKDVSSCYFWKGNAYESIKEFDKARDAYNTFLELFPTHPLAEDTRKMLPYLGMDPEEMLNKILANTSSENLVSNEE